MNTVTVTRSAESVLDEMAKLEVGTRLYNIVRVAGFSSLAEIRETPDSELLKFKNFGKKTLAELRQFFPYRKASDYDHVGCMSYLYSDFR